MAEYRRTTFMLAGVCFALLLSLLILPGAIPALFGFPTTASYQEDGR